MLRFIGAYINWFLALLALALWLGSVIWYFGPMVRKAWRERNDEYFKNW